MWREQKKREADNEELEEDVVEETLDCLQKKSPLVKQAICQAVVDALEKEATEA